MKISVTVDELLLWDGTPMPAGYTPFTVLEAFLQHFVDHGVDAFGFPHTAPVEDDPRMREVLERWVDAGHHLGNHTHTHACLNWVSGRQYVDDIKRAEDYIGEFVEQAPLKTFRYAMDMTGETEQKRGEVEDHLRRQGYVNAPITAWFGDFAWIAPYERALSNGDRETAAMLRRTYIDAAVHHLLASRDAAERTLGSEPPLIWLIHATPIAQDTLGDVFARFVEHGAEFIGLAEAMEHPVNRLMSPVSPLFRNHLQRLTEAVGDRITPYSAEVMGRVLTAVLPDGEDPFAVYDDMTHRMATRAGGDRTLWSWE
ncbi:polysaccharide deacetylase family protein [Tsukamurella spumae]|uniref:Polysaccharide deacetylase family protein n=2 Tax=Tsukamurella spumae TaxID=44753 RepID=A0A846X031_9ACTN|nr:polysaccharide deacetylase family protein [Tsukamurella spumae]